VLKPQPDRHNLIGWKKDIIIIGTGNVVIKAKKNWTWGSCVSQADQATINQLQNVFVPITTYQTAGICFLGSGKKQLRIRRSPPETHKRSCIKEFKRGS
jgi:hypothetical protein